MWQLKEQPAGLFWAVSSFYRDIKAAKCCVSISVLIYPTLSFGVFSLDKNIVGKTRSMSKVYHSENTVAGLLPEAFQ